MRLAFAAVLGYDKGMSAKSKKRRYMVFDPRLQREVEVEIRRDRRLKRSVKWEQHRDGRIVLRLPFYFPWRDVPRLIKQLEDELERLAKKAERLTDEMLAQRARMVNRKYFGGKVPWVAIRWVGNMQHRLGSVTLGGNTHGHIRISDRIQNWPPWVVDYVIAHEFVHLLLPEEGHSAKFWETLQQAYPLTERARGFIRGYYFAQGEADEQTTEETAL